MSISYNYRQNEKSPCFGTVRLAAFLLNSVMAHRFARTELTPNDAAHAAMDLARISRALHRINVQQCNGYQPHNGTPEGYHWYDGLTPDQKAYFDAQADKREARDERTETRLRIRAQGIAAEFGLTCYFQNDPRGCALYIGHGLTSANYSTQGVAC